MRRCLCFLLVLVSVRVGWAQKAESKKVLLLPIGQGWARSSVNAVVFRQHSVVTHRDTQFVAYYNPEGQMVLAKRRLGTSEWTVRTSRYTGNVRDAHNSISIAVDGKGFLHVAWDHHGHPLNYAQSVRPGALKLTDPMPMTGRAENSVTYPQFYNLSDGGLLFLYRAGRSGNGNVMLNRYDVEAGSWQAVQHPLIDGQEKRNAYWNQLAIDENGGWHLSWCWRESPDVASNHDIAYAYSPDEGNTWQSSSGDVYSLPITEENVEVAYAVPQGRQLINQTSMTVNAQGQPVIATYWRPKGGQTPQYHLVWRDKQQWQTRQIGSRKLSFELSGGGTKRIPVSRPQVVAGENGRVYVVFRDQERGGGISVATAKAPAYRSWRIVDVYEPSVGRWEPTYDPVLWKREQKLHLFVQRVGQGDGETLEKVSPQTVFVFEWTP